MYYYMSSFNEPDENDRSGNLIDKDTSEKETESREYPSRIIPRNWLPITLCIIATFATPFLIHFLLTWKAPYSLSLRETPPRQFTNQTLLLPRNWKTENVVLDLNLPQNWQATTLPYQFFTQTVPNMSGITRIAPADLPQSDPTGITIAPFIPSAEKYAYSSRFLPGPRSIRTHFEMDYLFFEDIAANYRRPIAPISPTPTYKSSIGSREALAADYTLISPSGSHLCTERYFLVNSTPHLFRLCAPADTKVFPAEYSAVLNSIQWIPRISLNFPQSAVTANFSKESIKGSTGDSSSPIKLANGTRIHGDLVDEKGLSAFYAEISYIPVADLQGNYGIFPGAIVPEVCSNEWHSLMNLSALPEESRPNNREGKEWLPSREIDGYRACGYSLPAPQHKEVAQFWFLQRPSGVWAIKTSTAATTKTLAHAKTPDQKELSAHTQEKTERYLQDITWVTIKKGETIK